MMGAVVLVLTGLAIYAGLDGASKTSGRNRNRTVAAYLAQQDQERMRTMDAAALAGYSHTRTVTVAGVKYKVTSQATYVNDSTGSISCTNHSSTAQYLKISSTVADPSGQNAPVVEDSLLSPRPGDGNASVQVVDRTGLTGVSGVPVSLQEPPGSTVTTDSDGCALFSFLDNATQYHVSLSLPGYVDVNGVNVVSGPITVVPSTVSVTQFQYDKAGSIKAQYPGACTSVSVTDSHMTINPRVRTFTTGCNLSDTPLPTNVATDLFPFTDKYAVYAGSCQSNDPTQQSPPQPATYISSPLGPGATQAVQVAEPPISLAVMRKDSGGNVSWLSGANVHISETDCSNTFQGATTTTNSSTSGNNFSQGYPYGTYDVCVDDGSHHYGPVSLGNTTSSGISQTLTIDYTSSSSSGVCA